MSQLDLIEIASRLRQLLAAYDNAGHALHASFGQVDLTLEGAAARLRPEIERSATQCHQFLKLLEEQPIFIAQRTRKLQDRAHGD